MNSPHAAPFKVFIEENSRFMESEGRRFHGGFDSYSDAIKECKSIIERSIDELIDYDDAEDELFELYSLYGDSAWITPDNGEKPFSSSAYAREYIRELYRLKPFLD